MFFRPRRAAERAFVPDAEGIEHFHPLGAFGPSYPVSDPGHHGRLFSARFTGQCIAIFALGFFAFWVIYYQGPDRGMKFAPPLLVAAAGLLAYRLLLRWLLRGLPPRPNLFRQERSARIGWSALLVPVYVIILGYLGSLIRELL